MADNNLKIKASVEMPSARQVNDQIKALEKKLNKLTVSGQFDTSALKNMTKQLDSIKATVSTVDFSSTALKQLSKQVENAINKIPVSGIEIPEIKVKSSALDKLALGAGLFADLKDIGKCRISVRISNIGCCFEYALLT